MRLAIAAHDPATTSETFIRMQYERLPCALAIHGGPVASETRPGGPIAPLRSLRGMAETAWDVGVRRTRWEGPQTRELARRLSRARIDTMLVNFGTHAAALLPACEAAGVRIVPHFHGSDAHTASVVEAHRAGYRDLAARAHRVVAVSRHMIGALVALGFPEEKLRLVRCGVDTGRFTPRAAPPADPLFFGVGRFVDKKAPYLTLLAFRTVRERHPRARLVLAGDGQLLEVTRNLSHALGLDGAVELPGSLSHEAVARHMLAATAFVQHSICPREGPARGDCEGTPVAVLEAMICGLPVVATRHAGIGEVVEQGMTGLLVEERDVDGMAGAMLSLCDDPALGVRLGAAARTVALERHTAERYVAGLLEALA